MLKSLAQYIQLSTRVGLIEERLNRSDERAEVVRYGLDRIDQTLHTADKETTRKSYSLEAEDLLIDNIYSAVLKRFKPGFYLDIGAAHPTKHSNTYFFYKLGWSGVCVEPNPDFHALYNEKRPHDLALNIGLSAKMSGDLTYHRFNHPYINGFYGQDTVDWHTQKNGQTYLGSRQIECQRITDFLAANVNRSVELLNIDVETLDVEILSAWDWNACKPLIICAEIHTTSLKDVVESDVAKILNAAGYTAVSRGWLSTIFVRDDKLKDAVVIGR